MIEIEKFLGLMNTGDTRSLPLGAFSECDNVMINNYADVIERPGFSLKFTAANIASSYGTHDHSALFFINEGMLINFDGVAVKGIADGFNASRYYWAEESSVNVFGISDRDYFQILDGQFMVDLTIPKLQGLTGATGVGKIPAGSPTLVAAQYYSNEGLYGPMSDSIQLVSATDYRVFVNAPPSPGLNIRVVAFLPDEGIWVEVGRTNGTLSFDSLDSTGAPIDAVYFDTTSPPETGLLALAFHMNKVVVATRTGENESKVMFSVPGAYHLFNENDYFLLPHVITDMCSVQGRLLITCDACIYDYVDGQLRRLTEYGTPAGKPISQLQEGAVTIWTNRGMASYPEYAMITLDTVRVAPGEGCSNNNLHYQGSLYNVICTDGKGTAYGL